MDDYLLVPMGVDWINSHPQWTEKLDSFYRPPPLTSYHHLLADPASASAATRPLLLAAGLYGATSLSLPAPPIPPPPPIPGITADDRRVGTSSGGPLDLSHLASSASSPNANGGVDLGANGGPAVAGGKLGTAASVHSLLQLHKSAGENLFKFLRTWNWIVSSFFFFLFLKMEKLRDFFRFNNK